MIVGRDKHGKELRCGDICTFTIKVESSGFNRKKDIVPLKSMLGVIVYDQDSYAFAFETLDDNAPMLLMHVVEYGSIEYVVSIGSDCSFFERCGDGGMRKATYCDDETASKWHRIYRSNLQELS